MKDVRMTVLNRKMRDQLTVVEDAMNGTMDKLGSQIDDLLRLLDVSNQTLGGQPINEVKE